MSRLIAEDQQLYNRTSLTSWAHYGSPPPFFFAYSRPPVSKVACLISFVFALHLYVSYVQSHHFPWLQPHELPSIRFSRLNEHIIRISHVSILGGGSFPVTHTVFSKGVAAVRARRLFSSTISGVRGSVLVPVLPLGRKLDWQPVLSRAPKDRTWQFSCSTHSL